MAVVITSDLEVLKKRTADLEIASFQDAAQTSPPMSPQHQRLGTVL
jgi:hypothetical protein